jgi:hypothetical protein
MITITVYLHAFYILLVGLVNPNSISYLIVHGFFSIKADVIYVVLVFMRGENLIA